MKENKIVSIEELELLLDGKELAIEIQQDGSIKTVIGEANNANPEILTLGKALDGTY